MCQHRVSSVYHISLESSETINKGIKFKEQALETKDLVFR